MNEYMKYDNKFSRFEAKDAEEGLKLWQ